MVEEVVRVEVEIEGELVEMASAPTEEARAEATEKWEKEARAEATEKWERRGRTSI